MSEPVIEVRHLSKSFGTHVVLRDVDFTVNPGDVTCICLLYTSDAADD